MNSTAACAGLDNASSSLRRVTAVDELAIATMRTLSVDAVQKAESMPTFGAFASLKDLEGKFAFTFDADADAARDVLAGGAAA